MKSEYSYSKVVQELSGNGKGMIPHTQCKEFLRHDHPCLGVDWIADHDFEAGWVHAIRGISVSDPIFAGHFSDAAMYPGTNLTQDINQVATILFTAMTGPLDGEVTAFTHIDSRYGHPIPPGCILDFAVWSVGMEGPKQMKVKMEGRVRDFPYYESPNKFGLKFKPAIQVESILVRAKRQIYDGIWF